jgi:hypothetical protein
MLTSKASWPRGWIFFHALIHSDLRKTESEGDVRNKAFQSDSAAGAVATAAFIAARDIHEKVCNYSSTQDFSQADLNNVFSSS